MQPRGSGPSGCTLRATCALSTDMRIAHFAVLEIYPKIVNSEWPLPTCRETCIGLQIRANPKVAAKAMAGIVAERQSAKHIFTKVRQRLHISYIFKSI